MIMLTLLVAILLKHATKDVKHRTCKTILEVFQSLSALYSSHLYCVYIYRYKLKRCFAHFNSIFDSLRDLDLGSAEVRNPGWSQICGAWATWVRKNTPNPSDQSPSRNVSQIF